ncbi:MAG: RNA degradosome polyphosphate kinase [Bacteroidales bacterium]|nr:RNA degradosome polyphosphate kinase [Bacteroidales bacterium]
MSKEEILSIAYLDRDVSWMYFNYRILQEAKKEQVPLLERLSFLGIYSNNLDEFFRVRVATLNRMAAQKNLSKAEANSIKKSLKTINDLNEKFAKEYSDVTDHVVKELEKHKIRIIDETKLNDEQKTFLTQLFYSKLNGSINPIWLSQVEDLSTLEDNRIYLAVEKKRISDGYIKYAVVKVPDRVYGRWQKVPSSDGYDNIMYLDDVIRFLLPMVFIGFKESQYRAFSFKFTKDAEMEMDYDANYGTLERIAAGVNSRKNGEAVRIVYDNQMPKEILKEIKKKLNSKDFDISLPGKRYQNHKDLMKFPDCGHSELKFPKWQQIMKPEFVDTESILDRIRQKDTFIHVPYHSFDGYIRVLQEAAMKPEVKAIKTTLYRLAKDSKVVKELITAAHNGKKVTAVVELLARFDEESNIMWSKRMQEEGVNVIYGVEGLKVHSKLLFIESKNGNIACVGTGNFHEGNARTYTDYLMMTARTKIVKEVEKVFDFIDRPFKPIRFNELMVSPISMKNRLIRMLDNEIKNAMAGKEAWVKIKINHITDEDMVKKIYQASSAGVKIDILVRGNCSLKTGIKNFSENLRCVGIIDRYLEHARILIFCNDGHNRYFVGSADWMPRNLSNRIEVLTPVYDKDMQADLLRTVEYGLRDTENGRIVDGKGSNSLQKGNKFRSQEALYNAYKNEQTIVTK